MGTLTEFHTDAQFPVYPRTETIEDTYRKTVDSLEKATDLLDKCSQGILNLHLILEPSRPEFFEVRDKLTEKAQIYTSLHFPLAASVVRDVQDVFNSFARYVDIKKLKQKKLKAMEKTISEHATNSADSWHVHNILLKELIVLRLDLGKKSDTLNKDAGKMRETCEELRQTIQPEVERGQSAEQGAKECDYTVRSLSSVIDPLEQFAKAMEKLSEFQSGLGKDIDSCLGEVRLGSENGRQRMKHHFEQMQKHIGRLQSRCDKFENFRGVVQARINDLHAQDAPGSNAKWIQDHQDRKVLPPPQGQRIRVRLHLLHSSHIKFPHSAAFDEVSPKSRAFEHIELGLSPREILAWNRRVRQTILYYKIDRTLYINLIPKDFSEAGVN